MKKKLVNFLPVCGECLRVTLSLSVFQNCMCYDCSGVSLFLLSIFMWCSLYCSLFLRVNEWIQPLKIVNLIYFLITVCDRSFALNE